MFYGQCLSLFLQLPWIIKLLLFYISISYTTNTYHLTNFQVTDSSSHLPTTVNLASRLLFHPLSIFPTKQFIAQYTDLHMLQLCPAQILITSCTHLYPLPSHIKHWCPDIRTFPMKTQFSHFSPYWFASHCPGPIPVSNSLYPASSTEIQINRYSLNVHYVSGPVLLLCMCKSIHNLVISISDQSCDLLVHCYRWQNKFRED